MKITFEEMEQMILDGKEKKEIQGEMSDMEYNRALHKILHKLGNVESDLYRLEYIRGIEELFFAAHELFEKSKGTERIFWKNRRDHLASIYITYKALQPVKKLKDEK